jgi:2-iminobutanoate/2-iminopropanoate deaminase
MSISVRVPTATASGAPAPRPSYSPAIRSGNLLFLSGQTPLDPTTRILIDGTMAEQTLQCLRNLQAVCAASNARLEDAIRCCIYLSDIATFNEVDEAYLTFFPEPRPARTTIAVKTLPGGAAVEIDAIVAIGA